MRQAAAKQRIQISHQQALRATLATDKARCIWLRQRHKTAVRSRLRQVGNSCIARWTTYKAENISRAEIQSAVGLLSILPLQDEDERGASVLLTKSFADKDRRGFTEIRTYVHEMLQSPPDGVMLVARLLPSDSSLLQPGKTSLIVGLAVLSFNTATREQMPTLQPPDHAAYLSNIAVDSQYRRQGIASVLLRMCEQITQDAQLCSLYLHARVSDSGPQAFYRKSGYLTAGTDNKMSAMWHHITPRILMYKDLSSSVKL